MSLFVHRNLNLGEKTLTSLLKCSSLRLPCFYGKGGCLSCTFPHSKLPRCPCRVWPTFWWMSENIHHKPENSGLCCPWAQIQTYTVRRLWARCTHVSCSSPDGRTLLQKSIPIFSQENLKLSCGHLTSCRWWRAVTASIVEWWQYEWFRYLLCSVITQTVAMLSNFLERVTTNRQSCLRGAL